MAGNDVASDVAGVFDSFPGKQSRTLWSVYNTLGELLPASTVDLSWGMPTFRCEGIIITSLLGFANHNSLFPGPEAIESMGDRLSGFTTTKGTIHFDKEKAPSKTFLRELVAARIRVINATYPKKSGQFLELYDNGRPKAQGKYRDGQMHGQWSFFRKDGTLLRTGSFRQGEQTGSWVTYGNEGLPYKESRFG